MGGKLNEIETSNIDRITQLHEEIVGAVRMTLNKAIEIGDLLETEKAKASHGEWSKWVEENLPFDIRTAQRYMKAYANRDQIAKNDSVSLLTDAYRLLEEPKAIDSDRVLFEMGTPEEQRLVLRELHQAWKHLPHSKRSADAPPEEMADDYVSGEFEDRQAIVDAMVKRDTAKLTEPSKIELLLLTVDWADYFMLKAVEELLLYEIRENINEKNRANREEAIRECKEHLR